MPVNSFENYPMSWKPSLSGRGKPLYIDLARQLEDDIMSGKLLPGTKLPPQRELADFLDINVSTVSRAFKICTQNGLIIGEIGSGTFVSYDAMANLSLITKHEMPGIIEMGSVIPFDTSYQEVTDILRKMVGEPEVGRLFGYGDMKSSAWQKEAAAKLIRKAGYPVDASRLIAAGGGQNAISAVLAGLFRSGDRIGTDPLTYPGIKSAAKMLGIQLVSIRHENGEICEEGLVQACRNEKIKGLYIMPDYQNPTAHIMSDIGRKMIARTAIEQELIVIEDGIYSPLLKKPKKAVAFYAPEQTVYILSLSKTISPGLRLAYAAPPGHFYQALNEAVYNLNLISSPFLLELASRLMASEKAGRLADNHRSMAVERNGRVNEILKDYEVNGTVESLFRWLILPEGCRASDFESDAYSKGVHVYGSGYFAVGKESPVEAVRLAVCAPGSERELEEALYILKGLLEKY